jgi:hypothetical protein
MRTAVSLITMTMLTALAATEASAEWRLYVNRDNKAWSLERAFVSNDECDRAARTLYKSGQALGVGCAEYPSPASTQALTSRPAEYARPSPVSQQRQIARADEPARTTGPRTTTVRSGERPTRSTSPRPVPVADRVAEPIASAPAAVIFPPSGGMEIRTEEAPRPAVAASHPAPAPRRQAAPHAAPMVAQRSPVEEDKNSTAVALARAAAEASAAAAQQGEAEIAKRETAVTADKAERRTHLAVFGGLALVITTGVAYSVYRVARTSPLRALAVCLMELGAITAALAYPFAELWARLKVSESIVLSWLPGVLAGVVVAGVGVIVLALERARKPARLTKTSGLASPQAPAELIKPGQYIKPGEPGKPAETAKSAEPVAPQPVRTLEPVGFLEPATAHTEASRPEIPKWAKPPAEPVKPAEPAKPADAVAPAAGGS